MKKNIFFTIFSIILLLCLLVNVFRITNGSIAYTGFSGLVSYLRDAPRLLPIDLPQVSYITDDWLILNPLRNFINTLNDLCRAGLFFAINTINVVGYLFYFIAYLFV